MSYEIVLEKFSGPLHKLLELIENKKYEITEVNLADITGDFLSYVHELENGDSRLLADFIAIAARLMLIKSKTLIPDLELTEEEEEGIKELESRLKLYKEFKQAEETFSEMWSRGAISFPKDPSPLEKNPVFLPSPELSALSLLSAISSMKSSVLSLKTQYEKYEAVNFEAYITDLISRIGENISAFSSVAKDSEKKEVIILFLALLHLLKDNKISVNQSDSFSEIIIQPKKENNE
jgi:segregation and condensation protein A